MEEMHTIKSGVGGRGSHRKIDDPKNSDQIKEMIFQIVHESNFLL